MFRSNYFLFASIFFVFFIKFIFLQFDYIARYSPIDDNLYIANANLLINNLVEYAPLTLSKLPSFPYLLYVLNKLSISYILFLNVLLFILSIFWINSKYNKLNNIENSLVLLLINLNPVTFSTDWNVIMREPILAISIIALILVASHSLKKYSIIFLLLFYPILMFIFFLREESFILYSLTTFLLLIYNKKFNIFFLTKYIFIPIFLFLIIFSYLTFVNQKKYEVPFVNDLIQGEFPKMIENISSISDQEFFHINIPITRNKIDLLFKISPTAKNVYKISPIVGQGTASCVDHNICSEMSLGYIIWWLKTKPYTSGYVNSHLSEQALYNKISGEIVDACNKSIIVCSPKNIYVNLMIGKYYFDLTDLVINYLSYPIDFEKPLLRNFVSEDYSNVLVENKLYKSSFSYSSSVIVQKWRNFLSKIYTGYTSVLMCMIMFSLIGSFYFYYILRRHVSSATLNFNFFVTAYLMILSIFSIFAGPFDARMILSLNIFTSFFVYQSFKEILIRFYSK